MPCRLLKGCHYTGVEDGAVNVIKLQDERLVVHALSETFCIFFLLELTTQEKTCIMSLWSFCVLSDSLLRYLFPLLHDFEHNLYSAFREFLVDLMADPGTLIPADIPSAKDNAFMPYNPRISKIPAHYSLNNYGVAYSGPKPFQGEGSSHNPTVESSSVMDRRPRPEKAEILPTISSSSADNGVGTSRLPNKVTPSYNLDHPASSAIGNMNYKGSRSTLAVDGGVRMNANVVPYNQNQDDPKNLFADLNPFHVKGPGKNLVYNKPAEKVDDIQRTKNNVAPGRPPVPLMWKSRYAYNEVPKKTESDYAEGVVPRNNREPNGYNLSSFASSSSSSSEKICDARFKSSGITSSSSKENEERNSKYGLLPSERRNELNNLSLADQNSKYGKEHPKESKDLQTDWIYVVKEGENKEIGLNDRGKGTHDRFMETSLKLKDKESSSSLVDSSTNRVDQVFDDVDVGECEIPWEDLVLGERIGLGKSYLCSDVIITTNVPAYKQTFSLVFCGAYMSG